MKLAQSRAQWSTSAGPEAAYWRGTEFSRRDSYDFPGQITASDASEGNGSMGAVRNGERLGTGSNGVLMVRWTEKCKYVNMETRSEERGATGSGTIQIRSMIAARSAQLAAGVRSTAERGGSADIQS